MLNNIEVAEIPAFLSCVRVAPETGIEAIKKAWKHLPLSMQFGVVQDYADSIGYDVCTTEHRGLFMYLITKDPFDDWVEEFDYPTRKEARTAAIKAFDEIVNSAT